MNEIINAIQGNLIEIVVTIIGCVAAWLGTQVKNIYKKYADNQTKQEIVRVSVQWVEQMVKIGQIAMEDRLESAKCKAISLLNSAGITITEEELEAIIESTVYAFTSSADINK